MFWGGLRDKVYGFVHIGFPVLSKAVPKVFVMSIIAGGPAQYLLCTVIFGDSEVSRRDPPHARGYRGT